MDPAEITRLAVVALVVAAASYVLGRVTSWARFRAREREIRRDTAARQRATVGGQVSEQLAPHLPGFPFRPSEARFLGSPVDYVVFVGADGKRIEKVAFVEVKSGSSRLSSGEKRLRDAVRAGRVEWVEYRVP